MGLGGFRTASAGLQPLEILPHIVPTCIPFISDHSLIVFISLFIFIRTFLLVFRHCSFLVDHLQLPGKYPLSLSILSIDFPLGIGPMSFANSIKDFLHLAHTLIPLPPYRCHIIDFGFSHLEIIPAQTRYNFVPYCPCVFLNTSRVYTRRR